MKRGILISLALILMAGQTILASTGRMTYSADWVSDTEAIIRLIPQGDKIGSQWMITSWQWQEEGFLKVSYSDSQSPDAAGFDARKITLSEATFPVQIQLAENGRLESPFPDLPLKQEDRQAILNLYYQGVLSGYPSGEFQGENTVTRGEFSKMLYGLARFSESVASNPFTDVGSHWAKPYILTLAGKGIVNGKGGGLFDPDGAITLGEVFAVLDRTFQVNTSKEPARTDLPPHWSNQHFIALEEVGIIVSGDAFYQGYDPEAKASRNQCALLMSRIVERRYQLDK